MKHRLRWLPWLSLQIIAANVTIVLMLGVAWYWMFTNQSMVYSDRLMSAFNIEPGRVHAMFVDEVERQLWINISTGLAFAVLASIAATLYIVRPLRALTRATDRLRQGRLSRARSKPIRRNRTSCRNGQCTCCGFGAGRGASGTIPRRLRARIADPYNQSARIYRRPGRRCFPGRCKIFFLMSDELNHLTALAHSIEAM